MQFGPQLPEDTRTNAEREGRGNQGKTAGIKEPVFIFHVCLPSPVKFGAVNVLQIIHSIYRTFRDSLNSLYFRILQPPSFPRFPPKIAIGRTRRKNPARRFIPTPFREMRDNHWISRQK
ncbi:MAG TPA: hypothetical protein VJ385_16635 [Fibrobacteria bacterium]|nr:hypothetical protein [Fibrobacteria bacterium]